nr:hypothetical protein RAR13_11890 [Aminobacter aminovorans]
MVKILACLLFLLSAGAAHAGKDDAEWNPPARFSGPYKGELTLRYLPPEQVFPVCAKMLTEANGSDTGTYPGMRGCSVRSENGAKCSVVVSSKPVNKATPEAILRHEIGHCNGWPFAHPD